ncbi:protein N-terminal asparagine amidohydrolase-like [Penaeus indicus]|uniref:protein N-terminal asparagine amidohydrolase-like n=1 Tax=Penaeus indicus TaxID=29960 RepID=UPI00300CBA03
MRMLRYRLLSGVAEGSREIVGLTPPPLTAPPSLEHLSLSLILPLDPHNQPSKRADQRMGVTLLETHAASATCVDGRDRARPASVIAVGSSYEAEALPIVSPVSLGEFVSGCERGMGSGAVGLAHFDKCSHDECLSGVHICSHDDGVMHLLTRVQELSMGYTEGRLELCVVGGFQDARAICEKVTLSLLNAMHKSPPQIHLVLLCTGEMNTTLRGNISWPLVKGIGVSTQTGKIFPATFTDKGPYLVLRSTRVFTGAQQMVDIYDCALGLLRIGPFNYEPHAGVELLLQQTDDVILQCLSTTPEVEGPTWVKMVREVLKHIKEHPFPAVTIFPDNRPHYFRRDNVGGWSPAELPNNNDSTPDANVQAAAQAVAGAGVAATGAWTQGGGVTTTSAPPTPAALSPAPWGASVPPSVSRKVEPVVSIKVLFRHELLSDSVSAI